MTRYVKKFQKNSLRRWIRERVGVAGVIMDISRWYWTLKLFTLTLYWIFLEAYQSLKKAGNTLWLKLILILCKNTVTINLTINLTGNSLSSYLHSTSNSDHGVPTLWRPSWLFEEKPWNCRQILSRRRRDNEPENIWTGFVFKPDCYRDGVFSIQRGMWRQNKVNSSNYCVNTKIHRYVRPRPYTSALLLHASAQ